MIPPEQNNPFLSLVPTDTLPESHKEQVLNTISTTKFLLEFVDLFTFRQAEANAAMLTAMLYPPSNENQ